MCEHVRAHTFQAAGEVAVSLRAKQQYKPLLGWIVALGASATRTSAARFATQGGVSQPYFADRTHVPGASMVRTESRWLHARVHAVVRELAVLGSHDVFAVAVHRELRARSLLRGRSRAGLFEHPSLRRTLCLGAVIGVLALTHTAPAILIAVLIVSSALLATHRRVLAGRDVARIVGIAAVVGALVSSPFWIPVALRYRLKVRNPAPSGWVWDQIVPHSLARFLADFTGRWPFAVMAIGLLIWILRRTSRPVDPKLAVLIVPLQRLLRWRCRYQHGNRVKIFAAMVRPRW
jgi:hypothetical protein